MSRKQDSDRRMSENSTPEAQEKPAAKTFTGEACGESAAEPLTGEAVGEPAVETLTGEACGKLRALWEEVFSEDSREFTDYYFKEKAVRNHAFALKSGADYIAMVHLSPYDTELRTGESFTCVKTSYLVGVATKREYRHRGYMDRLLKASLRWLYGEEQPFVFLMPANPEIYRPYQFTWIYEREEYELCALPLLTAQGTGAELQAASWPETDVLKGSVKQELRVQAASWPEEAALKGSVEQKTGVQTESQRTALRRFRSQNLPVLVDYVNQRLKSPQGKDVFIKRDPDYYRTMEKELRAQNGGCVLMWNREAADAPFIDIKSYVNSMRGYFLYTDEQHLEIQEALWDGEASLLKEKGIRTPVIMARIVHLKTMLSLLRTKEGEVRFTMEVQDPLINDNNGVWACHITTSEASVRALQPCAGETARMRKPRSQAAARLAQPDGATPFRNQACGEEAVKGDCSVTIEKLTAWIFGRLPAEECFCFGVTGRSGTQELQNNILCKLKRIAVFHRVFLNEIV